jgi:hypothetical protein
MEQCLPWKSNITLAGHGSTRIYEMYSSLTCLQEPATFLYPEKYESSPRQLILCPQDPL